MSGRENEVSFAGPVAVTSLGGAAGRSPQSRSAPRPAIARVEGSGTGGTDGVPSSVTSGPVPKPTCTLLKSAAVRTVLVVSPESAKVKTVGPSRLGL